jgi:hypothetical protein
MSSWQKMTLIIWMGKEEEEELEEEIWGEKILGLWPPKTPPSSLSHRTVQLPQQFPGRS